jgi:predicted GNAT family acetyltransferase
MKQNKIMDSRYYKTVEKKLFYINSKRLKTTPVCFFLKNRNIQNSDEDRLDFF